MKKRILLVFGGESSEHDVSIMSAKNVDRALSREKYDVTPCYIDREGVWWLTDEVVEVPRKIDQLVPVMGKKQMKVYSRDEKIDIDILFPVLHGKRGEDGAIQGLADMLHVSVVGPSTLGAAVTMEKDMTKRLLRDAGVPVIDWSAFRQDDRIPSYSEITEEVNSKQLFVKPSRAGSSVGVTKVRDESEYRSAIETAFAEDSIILIEKALSVREIEVAVYGNSQPQVSGLGEIIPGEEFYSYDDKYAPDSRAKAVIPANVEFGLEKQIRELAEKAYRATGGWGMARIDFFVDKNTGEVYVNEINTIPGFTNISMFPKLWREAGKSNEELIDKLVELALE